MLIIIIIGGALIGTAFSAALLFPFWKYMRRSLDKSYDYRTGDLPVKPDFAKTLFDMVVIAGIISLMIGMASWAVFSIRDSVTIFFLSVAVIAFLVWAVYGKKY